MNNNNFTKEEQETTVAFDRGSDTAVIYTSDPYMMKIFDGSTEYSLKKNYRKDGEIIAKEYYVNKDMIRFRTRRMKISESKRKMLSDRMKDIQRRNRTPKESIVV